MWSYIYHLYDYYILSQEDPRIKGYPIMETPQTAIILCFSYLISVKWIGPAIMKNRKPLEINGIIIYYNALQTLFSLTMVLQSFYLAYKMYNIFGCNPHVFRTDYLGLKSVQLSWVFLIARFTEFFDTIFFILRKKYNQVTTLHVVHHFAVPLICWVGCKIVPGSQYTFSGVINTFVHTFMYFYYMLSAMGPEYKKYLWWKKYMTVLQLVQFFIVIVHTTLTLASGCEIPQVFGYLVLFQAVVFFGLFLNFYRQTFKDNEESTKSKQNSNLFSNIDALYQKYRGFFEMCIPNQHLLYNEDKVADNIQADQKSEENIKNEKLNKSLLE